eukprot:5031228-Pyramimonas_sp.AAC.1
MADQAVQVVCGSKSGWFFPTTQQFESEGKLLSGADFQRFGGRAQVKNWKKSVKMADSGISIETWLKQR